MGVVLEGMRIFICCSKKFYDSLGNIKDILEANGHEITLPNSFDNPNKENEMRELGAEKHGKWKGEMFNESTDKIKNNDALLVLNFNKDDLKNYIGGATFLEMYDAFKLGKKIFLYNSIPEGMLYDEILGFNPVVIKGDLGLIKG